MLKKTITYTDFNGREVSEDCYFHFSKAELIEMEVSHEGGMQAHLQKIVNTEDGVAIMAELRKFILNSYGVKSEDGRKFIKNQELRDEFYSSEAYSQLFFELCTDADKAAEFVNGIIPAGLDKDMAKMAAAQEKNNRRHPSDPAARPVTMEGRQAIHPDTRFLTEAEVVEMDADDLKSGLATGRYQLAP
jgi:hypothetical protein